MKEMVIRVIAAFRGPEPAPEEIEERVEILEAKVRANKIAIDKHVANKGIHGSPPVTLVE